MKRKWAKPLLRMIGFMAVLILGWRFYQLADRPYGGVFWLHLVAAVVLLSFLLLEISISRFRKRWRKSAVLLAMVALGLPALTVSLLVDYRTLMFPETKELLSEEEWREDLDQLAGELKSMHPDLSKMISPVEFQQKIDAIRQNLGNWDDRRIKVEFMKLVASLDDGHTIMPPQPAIDFNVLPFVMHSFEDGYFVLSASRELADIEGAQILQIGTSNIENVFEVMQEHMGAENTGQKLDRFPLYGAMTELLYESGITASPESAQVTFQKDGRRFTKEIEGESYYQWAWFYFQPKDSISRLPYQHNLYRQHYWSEVLNGQDILYVNINNLQDQDGLSVADFAGTLERDLDELDYGKVVIDLRQNRGGDNFKSRKIASVIQDSHKANQPGKLFVLISRRTFSAAVNLTSLLENQTHAIFVGGETGQGPNQFGDAKGLRLRHSGIWVAVSSVDWRGSFAGDKRKAIAPHYRVGYRFDDYLNGQDPAMDFVADFDADDLSRPRPASSLQPLTYLTDEGQLVKVRRDEQGLWFLSINDYSDVSLHQVRTPISQAEDGGYETTLRHLQLDMDSGNELVLSVMQNPIALHRVDDDYETPFELLARGEVDAGIDLLKSTDAYDYLPLEQSMKSIGYDYFDNQQPELAIPVFSYIRDKNPDYTYSWSRLAYAQLRNGDVDDAIQNFEQALVLDPGNRTAQDMMIRLQQEMTQ